MKNLSLYCTKNGGDAGSIEISNTDYASVQNAMAECVRKHVAENPVDQPIAEVVIRWKSPDREYSYRVYDETERQFFAPTGR